MSGFLSALWTKPTVPGESNPAATTSSPSETSKPKPCCVCKSEKAARDECMLFSKSSDPAANECLQLVQEYKSCMAEFGFKV
ncbi:Cytochrome c oxidase copper chaperone [Microsporum audouinii]